MFVEIEQLHDQDMIEMIEKGMRGGMCQVSHKLAVATNEYMEEAYDNKPSSYNSDLETNNLYGLAISQKFPLKISSGQRKLPMLKSGIQGTSSVILWKLV